ncbi:hypothetical protein Cgig2_019991 [Carnegiea gigantea]|uniref:Uncharacterized protein n=1 Tax=Carnegiea gigantea TaxID=171969 RepID=A0A9Q1KCX2_9CARY|nr:hypothetical protein Cgig2_019991 [Carnegiea gigantea]
MEEANLNTTGPAIIFRVALSPCRNLLSRNGNQNPKGCRMANFEHVLMSSAKRTDSAIESVEKAKSKAETGGFASTNTQPGIGCLQVISMKQDQWMNEKNCSDYPSGSYDNFDHWIENGGLIDPGFPAYDLLRVGRIRLRLENLTDLIEETRTM